MFETTAIVSALLTLITFSTLSIKFVEAIGLETESPIAVFMEMLPSIDTCDQEFSERVE